MLTQSQLSQLSPEMRQCLESCNDCHSVCLNTLHYCLGKGGQHANPTHLQLMIDCSEICQTCTNFLLRSSQVHARACEICSEICDLCAHDCDLLANDQQMRMCADACRRCSDECRNLATSRAA